MRQDSVPLAVGADAKWREIVRDLENLCKIARPDEMEAARAALRELIGEVLVVEEGPNVFAYSKLNENIGYKPGAENAAPCLYLKPIRLR